ncbi:MAG: hypothetical protein ACP6IY_16750 [Promethearchaeia archaeon]
MGLIFIILIVGYIIELVFTFYVIINRGLKRKYEGSAINFILSSIALLGTAFIYTTLYLLSYLYYFSDSINIILWKLTILIGILCLINVALFYSFSYEYGRIPAIPFIIYIIFLGFTISILLDTNSISISKASEISPNTIITDTSKVTFIHSPISAFIFVSFYTLFLIYLLYTVFTIHSKSRNKDASRLLIYNTIFFIIPFIFLISYFITSIPIFRDLNIILIWANQIIILIGFKKQPNIFLALTNKIYYINIYHKSGVLLYSYKFVNVNNEIESQIWGNILIGLNHILSEFINKSDQIDVLKTKNSELIVHYDNELGFAVMVIANQKNKIIENLMKKFTEDFKKRYYEELNEILDLNKLINITEFKDAKNLIEKHFKVYL